MATPLFRNSYVCLVVLAAPLFAQPRELSIVYPEDVFPALRPLLEAAAKQSPELRARRATVDERIGQSMSQNASRNSSVYMNARVLTGYERRFDVSGSSNSNNIESGSVSTIDGSIWWNKPIFAWGNIERYAEMGDLRVEAAELEYSEAVRVQLNEVRASFLKWQLAEQQLGILEENVAQAEGIVAAQKQLQEADRVSEQKVLELEAQLLEAEESRAYQLQQKFYFRDRLALLVGDKAMVDAVGVLAFPETGFSTVASSGAWLGVLESGEASRPAIERERRYLEVDSTQAEVMDRTQRPTVDLIAGVVSGQVDTAQVDDVTVRLTGYVGLQVRWNIFDGNRSRGERMAALARMRAREARLDAAIARVRDEGVRLVSDLSFFQTQIEARKRRSELLARRIELADSPNAEDRISAKDQLDLLLDYLRAEQRIAAAKASYLMTMAKLAALVFEDPVAGA